MVAWIVRLKLQLLRNSLRRSWPQLVGLAFGALYGLAILSMAVVGLVALRLASDASVAATSVTLGGSVVTLGWLLVPLLVFGVDQTLDPARFATFAVPHRQLLLGMTAAAMVGIPGVVMTALGLATVITWSRSPLGVLVALVSAPVAVLTCVVLSRTVTTASTALSQSRRAREIGSTVIAILLLSIALLGSVIGDFLTRPGLVGRVGSALAWTPLGWAWSAPAQVVLGNVGTGLLQLLLALLLLAGLLAVWDRLLTKALQDPRARTGTSNARTAGLGWLGRLPDTPTGAVAARSLTYWRRDPRYVVSLGMLPLVPLALLLPTLQGGGSAWLLGMAPLAGFMLGWSMHNDLAYDGTAFWMHVASGASGVADRLGRTLPMAGLAAVLLPVYSVVSCVVAQRLDLLPATFGMGLGIVLAGWGVSFVIGSLKPYPVPQSGENPFSSPPGATGVTVLVQMIATTATVVASLPVIVTGLIAIVRYPPLGWVTLLLGVVTGTAYAVVGLRQGGRIYDRRAPELLADLARAR